MPTNSIDTVVSCECFEHNKYWLETFVNMTRMLRPGGLFIMSCGAPGRIEHGTVRRSAEASLTASFGFSDYYANLSEGDFRKRLSLDVHFEHCGFVIPRYSNDLYFIGIKRAGEVSSVTGDRFNQTLAAMEKIAMPSGTSAGALRKRRLLSMTGRMLERMLGGRRYHDITLKVHRYMTR